MGKVFLIFFALPSPSNKAGWAFTANCSGIVSLKFVDSYLHYAIYLQYASISLVYYPGNNIYTLLHALYRIPTDRFSIFGRADRRALKGRVKIGQNVLRNSWTAPAAAALRMYGVKADAMCMLSVAFKLRRLSLCVFCMCAVSVHYIHLYTSFTIDSNREIAAGDRPTDWPTKLQSPVTHPVLTVNEKNRIVQATIDRAK